ncbi:MFS transporter [Petroclostridium sp. X23]|uniref:MFS transporter n=1 Tax=Petroclostridium sp. X23 TaxID=3045146 RepID=UPI0024AE0C02|nr:MFS transporter [Petroclostridium sp. X23]WHH57673.1 MFS transporter [Petroclostridium sp. X23]
MERWRINLYTIWIAQIVSLMSFGFGLPFLPFYIQDMGVTDPDQLKLYTGILSAAPAITMGIMSPLWGIAADKWGKKTMLLRAMLAATLILCGLGLVTKVEHIIILRFVQGMFTGTVTASAALVASGTPSHRMSYALGFLSSSTFIGFSAGPAIGGVVAEMFGYRISFFIGAALMLIDFFLVLFIVNENKAPVSSTIEELEEHAETNSGVSIFTSTLIAMLLVLFFMRVSRTVFNPYIPLFIQELLSTTTGTAKTTGIINGIIGLMTAAAGLILSRLGDKYDKLMVMKVLLSAGILLSAPLFFLRSIWSFAVVYSIFFFAIGGIEPIVMSITSESISPEKRGTLFGIQGLVGSIGWAISPMLGSIVSIQYSINSIFLLIPVSLLMALIMVQVVNIKMQ